MKCRLDNLKVLSLYVLSFILLFTPDFGHVSFFLNPSIIILCSASFFAIILNKRLISFIKHNHLLLLLTGILCASFISIYISIYAEQKIEYILYFCFVLQIINFISIIIILKDMGYSKQKMFAFIINCFLIQALIICLMYQFRPLKLIANNLYFTNLNVKDITPFLGIEKFRIYGITGDYTYATPIAMAYVASVSLIIAVFYNKKRYYLNFILLLLTSLLNGRTGVMIVFLAVIFIIIMYFINNVRRFNKTFLMVLFFGIFFMAFIMIVISFSDSVWAVWVRSGFFEIKNLFMNKEKSGNLAELLDNMIFFPEGWHNIFGYGHSVFVENIDFMGGKHSDIGYINDLFRGGLIYMILLYIPIFCFILGGIQKETCNKKMYRILKYISFIFIILSNYKGECMNSNTIFNTILYICIVCGISTYTKDDSKAGKELL